MRGGVATEIDNGAVLVYAYDWPKTCLRCTATE